MNKLEGLIGAEVNYVRFGNQVDINLIGGSGRDNKYANLQIEAQFQLINNHEVVTIDPNNITTLTHY